EFDVVASQSFANGGGGGITKVGSGSLTLTGFNSYSGPTIVNEGRLIITPNSVGGGNVTVADGAAFGVQVTVADSQFLAGNLTLGSATGVDLDVNLSIAGNPNLAP